MNALDTCNLCHAPADPSSPAGYCTEHQAEAMQATRAALAPKLLEELVSGLALVSALRDTRNARLRRQVDAWTKRAKALVREASDARVSS